MSRYQGARDEGRSCQGRTEALAAGKGRAEGTVRGLFSTSGVGPAVRGVPRDESPTGSLLKILYV